jgi:hypothetical protein
MRCSGRRGRSTAVGCAALILLLTACVTTSHVLLGQARAPIRPDEVQLYLEPPAKAYEKIAALDTSSKRSWSFSSQGQADVVIRRLKEEAAKLGANGVLLQGITDEPGTTVATGVGTQFYSARGTIDLGLSGSGILSNRFGRGIAIYLDPARGPVN